MTDLVDLLTEYSVSDSDSDNDNDIVGEEEEKINKHDDDEQSSDEEEITNHQPEMNFDTFHFGLSDSDASGGEEEEEKEKKLLSSIDSYISNNFTLNLGSDDTMDNFDDDEIPKTISFQEFNKCTEMKCCSCSKIPEDWVILSCSVCKERFYCSKCFNIYNKTMKTNPDNCIIKLSCDFCVSDGGDETIKPRQIQYIDSIQRQFNEEIYVKCLICSDRILLEHLKNHIDITCDEFDETNSKDVIKMQTKMNKQNNVLKFFKERFSKETRKKNLLLGKILLEHSSTTTTSEHARTLMEDNKLPEYSNNPIEQKFYEILFNKKESSFDDSIISLYPSKKKRKSQYSNNRKTKKQLTSSIFKKMYSIKNKK